MSEKNINLISQTDKSDALRVKINQLSDLVGLDTFVNTSYTDDEGNSYDKTVLSLLNELKNKIGKGDTISGKNVTDTINQILNEMQNLDTYVALPLIIALG
jgi:hypothetical protein